MAGRHQHVDALDVLIGEWTRERSNTDAMHTLQAAGVPAVACFTNADIYHDPHDTYRRTSIKIEDLNMDPALVTYGIPWRLSETPGAFRRLGQRAGTDNQAFFQRYLGLSAQQVGGLEERKILH